MKRRAEVVDSDANGNQEGDKISKNTLESDEEIDEGEKGGRMDEAELQGTFACNSSTFFLHLTSRTLDLFICFYYNNKFILSWPRTGNNNLRRRHCYNTF